MNFKINCKIYPYTLHIFIEDTLEQSVETYQKYYKTTFTNDTNGIKALFVYPLKDNSKNAFDAVLLFGKGDRNLIRNIHHECIHAAIYILHHVGVEISWQNDETIAYLSTYFFENILKKLNADIKYTYKR